MSIQPWLNLNGILYTLDQLKSGAFKSNLHPFEQSTLNFCHDWLTSKQEFQIQTSGSTGTPKIITVSRKQMEDSANLTITTLKLKPNYTSLVCLDTKYIAGQMMLVRSLLLGMNSIVVDPTSNPFEKILPEQSIDFAAFVPYQLQAILNSPELSRLGGIRCTIIGGAPLDRFTRNKLESFDGEFYATYGMTETISHIALQRLNGAQKQDYFETLANIEISKDHRGCLVIEASKLDSEKIITNDLVEIVNEKKFRWLGRWDNVINSGGIKIVPEKIELIVQEIFDSLELTNRFFIAGLPDEKLTQRISLIVEGFFTEKIKDLIEEQFKLKVNTYERPKGFIFIQEFVQTENGKIKRNDTLDLPHQTPMN